MREQRLLLRDAITRGDCAMLQNVLSSGSCPREIFGNFTVGTILSMVVKTGNINMINLVIQNNLVPDNKNYDCCRSHTKRECKIHFNTFNCAIKTMNIEIIKIVHQHGALPDTSSSCKNSLTLALLTKNIEIVKEVLLAGGLPFNNNILEHRLNKCFNCYIDTFNILYDLQRASRPVFVSCAIDLVMCFGSRPSSDVIIKIIKKIQQHPLLQKGEKSNYKKILCCYALLNERVLHSDKSKIYGQIDIHFRIDFNKLLKSTSNSLIPLFNEKKHIIEKAIICLPMCCVDVVLEYMCNISSLKYMCNIPLLPNL